MAYQILGYYTSQFTTNRVYSLLCDTTSDLPASVDGYNVGQGWTAKIISDGSSYVANSTGTWVLQPSTNQFANVYTKAETDALLVPLSNQLDRDDDALKELIPSVKNFLIVTDVDERTTNGVTITYNGNGTYTIDSAGQAASADGYFYLARSAQNPLFPKGTVISGCSGGSSTTYYISIAGTSIQQYDSAITLSADTSGSLLFTFKSGQVFDNLVIKPMTSNQLDWSISQNFEPHYLRLIHNSIQVNLASPALTWTQSASGLYYSSLITIPGITRVYSVTKSGFSSLRATDVVEPVCLRSNSWSGIRIYSNTNSFLSSSWITVSCIGEM